jgi:YbbR domain-containing protein
MFKKFFTKDLSYKITAVVLAILLKLYFISPRNQVTDTVNVQISLIDVPRTMAVVSPPYIRNLSTKLTVNGPRSLVEQYKNNPKEIKIPLMHLSQKSVLDKPITERVNLRDFVNVPNGLEIDELEPRQLDIVLDRSLKKNVSVDVKHNIVGELQEGFELKSITATPSFITITGPTAELNKIESLDIQKIDISRYTESKEEYADLETVNDSISYDIWRVRVNIEIVQKTKDKLFINVPVNSITDEADETTVLIAPAHVRAKLKIRERDIDSIKIEDIKLIVDTRLLPPGEHFVEPKLENADERFSLIWTMPRTVSVKIK